MPRLLYVLEQSTLKDWESACRTGTILPTLQHVLTRLCDEIWVKQGHARSRSKFHQFAYNFTAFLQLCSPKNFFSNSAIGIVFAFAKEVYDSARRGGCSFSQVLNRIGSSGLTAKPLSFGSSLTGTTGCRDFCLELIFFQLLVRHRVLKARIDVLIRLANLPNWKGPKSFDLWFSHIDDEILENFGSYQAIPRNFVQDFFRGSSYTAPGNFRSKLSREYKELLKQLSARKPYKSLFEKLVRLDQPIASQTLTDEEFLKLPKGTFLIDASCLYEAVPAFKLKVSGDSKRDEQWAMLSNSGQAEKEFLFFINRRMFEQWWKHQDNSG